MDIADLTQKFRGDLAKVVVGRDMYETGPHAKSIGWKHELPAIRYKQLLKLFGKPEAGPVPSTTGKAGFAIWTRPPLMEFMTKLVVNDEMTPHFNPAPHVDFMYSTAVSPFLDKADVATRVQGLGESVVFDTRPPESGTAGCHFLPANLVSHAMIFMVATGQMKVDQARIAYGALIAELAKEWEKTSGNRADATRDDMVAQLQSPYHASIMDLLHGIAKAYDKDYKSTQWRASSFFVFARTVED